MRKWLPVLLGLVVGLAAGYGSLMSMGGIAVAQQPLPDVGHYKCYTITPTKTVKFDPPLPLKDQFDEEAIKQARSKYLCAPVSKDGSPIFNPETFLKMYAITGPAMPKNQRPHLLLKSLNLHFPDEEVDVVKPSFLLVPTLKEQPGDGGGGGGGGGDCLIICG
jgi:hypothetical protein